MKNNHLSLKPGRMLSLLNDFAARRVKQDLPIKKKSQLAASILFYDHVSKLLGLWIIRPHGLPEPRFLINDFFVSPLHKRHIQYDSSPLNKAAGMICWFPIRNGFRSFEIYDGEGKIPFLCNKKITHCVTPQHICRPGNRKNLLTRKNRLALFLSRLWFIKDKYSGCWLFADRDFKADDNAEHLYRWIIKHRPGQKAFFALSKNSDDWQRLEAEGFKLVDIHSLHYFFAFIHSNWLIASNITDFIYKSNWRKKFAHILNQHVCYLQHGITINYQPSMNKKTFRLLITAAEQEYYAFAHDPKYDYTLCSRELRLTGLPRHDTLIEKAKHVRSPKTVLLMPSWRENIVNDLDSGSGKRSYYPYFVYSDFFLNWNAVLKSKRFHAAVTQNGYRLRVFPHPYLRQQLRDFHLDDDIVVNDVGGSIQDILADTALLITDYSSISMEVAMLGRPVLYYQFDRKDFLEGGHWVRSGYFNYEKDGFGEVCLTPNSLVKTACEYLSGGCAMKHEYLRRKKSFFAFNDQNNCKRVYEAIKDVVQLP